MNPMDYPQFLHLASPEVILVVAALLVVAMDLLLRSLGKRKRWLVAALIGCAGCIGAIIPLALAQDHANLVQGMLVSDPLTRLVQIFVLVLTIFTLVLAVDSNFTEHIGEYVLIILFATSGMMFLVSAQDLVTIFVSLELLSLSLYVLTAFDKRSARSAEAALKYFFIGGMSAAFLLYGFSLLYGLADSTSLSSIAAAMHGPPWNPLLILAMVTTILGFGFKIAVVPFHFWAPDVYQGAPAPSAGLIASGSKVASFFVFFQIMVLGFGASAARLAGTSSVRGWVPMLAAIAILSMLLGNLVAIRQTNLRRLIAYSAIAHGGYMLLAIVSHTDQSLAALLYYAMTYGLTTLGAFGVIGILEQHPAGDSIEGLNGLHQRSPFLSTCLGIFVLSLAGIPPLAGFFGKFYLFVAVIAADRTSMAPVWLVLTALFMSAVSLYYYLRILKHVFIADPPADSTTLEVPIMSRLGIGFLTAAVVVLGCAPHLLLRWIQSAILSSGL